MGIVKQVQRTGSPERRTDNVMRRGMKTVEEVGEMCEAILSATSASGAKGKTWLDIVEEACDVTIMGLDVALTHPPEWGDIDDEMWREIVKKIIEMKLAKWKHQLRGKSTITAEGRPPKFTEEEHERVLGMIYGEDEEPQRPGRDSLDAMDRALDGAFPEVDEDTQAFRDRVKEDLITHRVPVPIDDPATRDKLRERIQERHLASDYDMTGTEFIYASDPPGTRKLSAAEQLDAEEDEELHK